MKKLQYFLILIIACSPFLAHSQGVSFGAKAGMNLSNIYSNIDFYDWKYIPGFFFGGYVNYPLTNKLYFSPEVMYSQQGYSYVLKSLDTEVKNRSQYLNFLPLTAKMYFGEAKLINVLVGPQLGWLMRTNLKVKRDDDSVKLNVTEDFSSFDLSAVIGLGIDLKSGLNFGSRMNLGLTNFNGAKRNEPYMRNIVFQTHVGYTFINR
jgi:hypothetical protein